MAFICATTSARLRGELVIRTTGIPASLALASADAALAITQVLPKLQSGRFKVLVAGFYSLHQGLGPSVFLTAIPA